MNQKREIAFDFATWDERLPAAQRTDENKVTAKLFCRQALIQTGNDQGWEDAVKTKKLLRSIERADGTLMLSDESEKFLRRRLNEFVKKLKDGIPEPFLDVIEFLDDAFANAKVSDLNEKPKEAAAKT